MTPDEEPKVVSEQAEPGAPAQPRRRSRRGGRRRPQHGPRLRPSQPAAEAESETQSMEAAIHQVQPERPIEQPRTSESAIHRAIDQVSEIIEELKGALNQMEEVLETVELAERQKIDDEREIESLQRALRQLHHSPSNHPRQHR